MGEINILLIEQKIIIIIINSSVNDDFSFKRKCEHIQTGKAYAVKVISRR